MQPFEKANCLLLLFKYTKPNTKNTKIQNTRSEIPNSTSWEDQWSPAAPQYTDPSTKYTIRNQVHDPKLQVQPFEKANRLLLLLNTQKPKYQTQYPNNQIRDPKMQIQPFEKANGLLLFLNPFPSRPLLLISLHPTLPPNNLLRQILCRKYFLSKTSSWCVHFFVTSCFSHPHPVSNGTDTLDSSYICMGIG